MVTMDKVAKEAGVLKATVSRVSSNSQLVKHETRDIILKLINKFRYEPNFLVQSLTTKKTYILGIIIEDLIETGVDIINPQLSAIDN